MLLKIRHGLLEITNYPSNAKSAIVINNEIVLTSANILESHISKVNNRGGEDEDDSYAAKLRIVDKLQNNILINAQESDSEEANFLNSLNCQITFDRRSLTNRSKVLTRYRVKILYLFSCIEVSKCIRQILARGGQTSSDEWVLSSFVLLCLDNASEADILQRFISHITNYLRFVTPVQILGDVLTICTPFGSPNFYKTINIGKVSNVLSPNGCLFVLSNYLPTGCEGAAVFNDKLRLIGLIICTSLTRHNDNFNITLAAGFSQVVTDFLKKLGVKLNVPVPRELTTPTWERSMVVVTVNGMQCTGTLVKILNKSFILTCSHVIYNTHETISCRNVDGNFDADVVWKNPKLNQPFDVALLKPRTSIPSKYFVKLSTSKPHIGQLVYNAGFPFFINFALEQDFNPSVFQGRIIKYTPGAILSDGLVQDGQSGGPMFDENGRVLGVCVSNFKKNNIVYPNCNTAVPISDIRKFLELYAKTNDLTVLDNLVADETMQQMWTLGAIPIHSKL